MSVAPTDTQKNLTKLEAELKRLEAEYNMFFAGRLPQPPLETRARVAAIVKQYDRTPISNTGDRFRFTTLQSRYATLVDLWDRGLRAREEGRGGPFAQRRPAPSPAAEASPPKILHVATLRDPMRQMDALHDLYDSLAEARRETGAEPIPFHKFADLVKKQVEKLTPDGAAEVAFRVAIANGKVKFTARALAGPDGEELE